MVALGQFLLGVAGCVAGILLLAWVGAKVDLWLGGRPETPRQNHDFWDD